MAEQTCVIRQVNGIDQYIPINDAAFLTPGERSFRGIFTSEIEHDGPSKSHARTICLPRGELTTTTLSARDIHALGK